MATNTETGYPRSWRFDEDGLTVEGVYTGVTSAPSKYGPVPVIYLNIGGEPRSIWLTATALRSRFRDELARRGTTDFESGEQIRIEREPEQRTSGSGNSYWAFKVTFLDRQPATAAEILASDGGVAGPVSAADDDIPFRCTIDGAL